MSEKLKYLIKITIAIIIIIIMNNQVEEDEMGGPCSTNWEKRNAYRLFVGKPEGKRPLGR
jgi:hypothetical protein